MALEDNAEPLARTAALHGLLDSVPEDTTEARWEMGLRITPDTCTGATVWDPVCGGTPTQATVEQFSGQTPFSVIPLTVDKAFTCLSTSLDIEERALRAFNAVVSHSIENEFWTGTIGSTNPVLNTSATIITGSFGLAAAWQELNKQLSNCGGGSQGVIHAPSWLVDAWMYGGASMDILDEGRRLVSRVRGDTIVAGTGYPGTGPAAANPGARKAYVFATGPVAYKMTAPEVLRADPQEGSGAGLIRSTNQIEVRVKADFLVRFDTCCHFGLIVDAATA